MKSDLLLRMATELLAKSLKLRKAALKLKKDLETK
jgi:hypothetical protein